MIHVCFGLYDKTGHYSKFTGTAMLSLLENSNASPRTITVHILHDNTLTLDNREKFAYLAGQYNQLVKFYNVEELCKDKIAEIMRTFPVLNQTRYSVATFYRFFTINIFSPDIEKIIYLDSDVIVNLDAKELWQIELGNKPLAAVSEYINGMDTKKFLPLCSRGYVKPEDYFNAGVLLMNLNFLCGKEELLLSGIKFISDNNNFGGLFDQDILNYLFAADTVKLPVKFNYFIKTHRGFKENLPDKKIYHYTDTPSGVGLGLDTDDPFNKLWMKYFIRTPWFEEETIGRLYTGVRNLNIELKQSMVTLSAVMSGKTRAFFAPPQNIDGLKNFFAIRDDEEIILAENQTSFQKLLDAMKKSQGKKVFFIMLPYFPYQVLIQAGFVLNRDFVNGIYFLSEAQGVPLNSYRLIKEM